MLVFIFACGTFDCISVTNLLPKFLIFVVPPDNTILLNNSFLLSISHFSIESYVKYVYNRYVGQGNPCLVIYDYLKIIDEQASGHNQEHQIIRNKSNSLKKIALDCLYCSSLLFCSRYLINRVALKKSLTEL